MAKKSKNPVPNPPRPRSISDSSSDGDGAPIYTPPETESNDGPSSSTYLPDASHLRDVIHGLQNVKLAQEKTDGLESEASDKDVSAAKNKRGGRSSKAKQSVPADTEVSHVIDSLQNLTIPDQEANDLKQIQLNAKWLRNRKEKERKKRRKARCAEEDAKKELDATVSNEESKYRIIKDAGYRGMKHFMSSYGLQFPDQQDIDVANELIKQLGSLGDNSPNIQQRSTKEDVDKLEGETGAKDISNYKWLKNSGWGDMKKFMIAYGYKWGDYDDHFAAKELIQELRKDQASEEYAEPELPQPQEKEVKVASTKPKTKKETVVGVASTKPKTKKKTVVASWEDYFGNATELKNWQRLCIDVGMEEIPTSITKCRKALGKVWVNIFDFLDAKAAGKPVKRYKSERQLATYTMNSGKIYPKQHAKQGGPARALLAHIYGH